MKRLPQVSLVGLALAILFVTSGCDHSMAEPVPATSALRVVAPGDPKVVILLIDGPRFSETFGDPTHQYIPRIWNELRPQGALYENVRNLGETRTIPGHASILSGTWQMLANDGSERPTMPTLFEYYRAQTGADSSDAALIGGKAKLSACAYSTHVGYGAAFGAAVDVGYATDVDVEQALLSTLQNEKPHLVMVSLSQVDLKAHSGVWDDYVAQLTVADDIAASTWAWLQNDAFYAGQTYMFITADHGRHDDAHGGFQSHGDDCDGCQRLTFMALGPDIRSGYVAAEQLVYRQRDLCKTAAQILGISTPLAGGDVMSDMFVPVTTGIH